MQGLLAGLASAVFYTFFLLLLRRSQMVADRLSPAAGMAVVSLTGVVFSAVCGLSADEIMLSTDFGTHLQLFVYGLLSQCLTWAIVSKALPLLTPSQVGLLFMVQPTLAFVWDVLLLGRETGGLGWTGVAVTLVAVAVGGLPGRTPERKTVEV